MQQHVDALRRVWEQSEFEYREDMDTMREAIEGIELESALMNIVLVDAEDLIRYLIPDLSATRPRAEELVTRIRAVSFTGTRQDT